MANIDAGINSLLLEKILRDMQAAQGAPVKRLSIDEINQSMKRTTPEKKKKIKKKPIETTLPTRIDKNAKPLDPLGLKRTALDNRLSAMGKDPLTWLKQKAMDNIQAVKPVEKGVSRYGYATAEQNIAQKKQVQAPFNENQMTPENTKFTDYATKTGGAIGSTLLDVGKQLIQGGQKYVENNAMSDMSNKAEELYKQGKKDEAEKLSDFIENYDKAAFVYDKNGNPVRYDPENNISYYMYAYGKDRAQGLKLVPFDPKSNQEYYYNYENMLKRAAVLPEKFDKKAFENKLNGNPVNIIADENNLPASLLNGQDFVKGVIEGGSQIGIDMAMWKAGSISGLTKGALRLLSAATTYGNVKGSDVREKLAEGNDIKESVDFARIDAAINTALELGINGMPGVPKSLSKTDSFITKKLTERIRQPMLKALAQHGLLNVGEGVEEIIQAAATSLIESQTTNKGQDPMTLFMDKKPLEQGLSAFFSGLIFGGGAAVKAVKNKTDLVYGLTQDQTKYVEGLAKTKNDKGKSIGFDKAVEVYQKNKALESQIGFTPDFDEQAVAPEDAKNIPLRFTTTGNKRVDDFNAMQSKVLKNTTADRNQAYNNIRTVMELGIDEFILSDKEVQQMNKPTGTGAFWNERLNAVVVNAETKRSFASKLFHEFAHIRENSSVQSELANMVIAYRNANPTTLKDGTTETAEQEMARIKDTYEKAGVSLNEQELRNEFVAEELARLSDKDAKFYQSVFGESPTVFQRLGQYVQKKLGFLKEGSEEQRYFKKIQELQKKAYDEVKNQRKQKADTKNSSDKNLIEDNLGRELSKGQQEFFKDSKVRDEEGRLLTVYHGTPNKGFTVFDNDKIGSTSDEGMWGSGFYFGTQDMRGSYGENQITAYLNIKNPFKLNNFKTKDEIADYLDIDEGNFIIDNVAGVPKVSNNQINQFTSHIKDKGHDGVVVDMGGGFSEIVAFSPNQIKSIDNLNPTEDDDIRYLIEDPRLEGDFSDISDRATKSMVKQFPELAPYLKEMAGYMQMEVEGGFRGGRSVSFDYNGDTIQTGGKRFVIADDIASILDSKIIKSYAHLSETLQDIQNGEGWNAAAKYLEMYLDERLTNGYTTDGMDIPPNEAYVGMKEMLKKGVIDNTIEGQLPYAPDKWNEYEPTSKDQAEYEAMQGLAPIRKEPSQKDVDEYAEMQGLVPIREDLKPNKFTAMKESSAKALSELEKTRDAIVSDYNQKINQAKIELHKKKRLSKQGANLQARIIRLEKMRDDRIAEFDARIARQEIQVEKRTVTEEEHDRIERGKKLREEFTKLAEKYTDSLDENFRERRGIFVGLRYIGSTTDRNIDRVAMSREIAKGLKEDYVKKDDRAYELSLEDKLYYKGKLEAYNLNDTESKYAAMDWEIKHNPKTTINPDSVKSFYAQHKSKINQAKVDAFLETAFEINEVLFNRMNEVRIKTGRKPIPRLEGHMPHFNLDIMKGGVWDIAQLFGLEVQRDGLPTSIAGKTENFKPVAPFNKFAQRRTGDKTEYNILKAMDMYIDKAVEEIHFTESVMRWRHLENSFRSKYDPKGLEKEIENIKNNEEWDEMQILDKIESARDEFYKNNSSEIQYPHLVTWIMDYANNLANKTNPIVDRLIERLAGRHVNSFIEGLNSIAVKNMLTSFGTAISQIVPVVNALSTYGEVNMIKGITQMLMEEAVQIKAYLEDAPYEYRVGMMGDSVMNKSSFAKTRLTKRVRLGDTTRNKISDKAFEMTSGGVDGLVTNLVIRAGYNKGLSRGYTEEQAIAYADESSRAMMQDRSKVHAPLLFQSKALRFLTNFQIEPLNDILYAIYDSRKYAGGDDDDKLGALINYLIRYIVMSYLINAFSKSTKGSKVVLSPADIVIDSMKVLGNEDLSSVEKTARVASVFTDQLPFSYILDTFFAIDTSGARIALQSMVPGWRETGDAIADLNDDNKDNDAGAKYNLYKEWSKPLYYLLMPAFGGQIKKSIEGIGQYYEITDKGIEKREVPGSYTAGGDLRYEVPDTPEAKGQALLFGQYSSSGAREYFDTGAKPTSVDTIKSAKEADLAPTEYKKIKKKAQEIDTNKDGKSTYEEKLNYLESLDIPIDSKTAIANDLAPTREYKVDMAVYDKMSNLAEYDMYAKNPDEYRYASSISNFTHYQKIEGKIKELKDEMWGDDAAQREAVLDYIDSTNLDGASKELLKKKHYSSYSDGDAEIMDFISSSVEMKKDGKIRYISQNDIEAYKANGWKASDSGAFGEKERIGLLKATDIPLNDYKYFKANRERYYAINAINDRKWFDERSATIANKGADASISKMFKYVKTLTSLNDQQKLLLVKMYYPEWSDYDTEILDYINSMSRSNNAKKTIALGYGFTAEEMEGYGW